MHILIKKNNYPRGNTNIHK